MKVTHCHLLASHKQDMVAKQRVQYKKNLRVRRPTPECIHCNKATDNWVINLNDSVKFW